MHVLCVVVAVVVGCVVKLKNSPIGQTAIKDNK